MPFYGYGYGFNPGNFGYGSPTANAANSGGWLADLISLGLQTAGTIWGNNDTSGNGIIPPPGYTPAQPAVGGSSWWDDLFGGGNTINLFGMEVSRGVVIAGVVYLLFFKGKGKIRL